MIGMLSTYPKKTKLQMNEYAWNWKIYFFKQKNAHPYLFSNFIKWLEIFNQNCTMKLSSCLIYKIKINESLKWKHIKVV